MSIVLKRQLQISWGVVNLLLSWRWSNYPQYYMREEHLWAFNESLASDTGISFTLVRESVAYNSTGAEIAASTPVYETV